MARRAPPAHGPRPEAPPTPAPRRGRSPPFGRRPRPVALRPRTAACPPAPGVPPRVNSADSLHPPQVDWVLPHPGVIILQIVVMRCCPTTTGPRGCRPDQAAVAAPVPAPGPPLGVAHALRSGRTRRWTPKAGRGGEGRSMEPEEPAPKKTDQRFSFAHEGTH